MQMGYSLYQSMKMENKVKKGHIGLRINSQVNLYLFYSSSMVQVQLKLLQQ